VSVARRWTVAGLMVASVVMPAWVDTTWAASSAVLVDRAGATHATRGVVQAIDAHTIVIARSGDRGRLTFNLTPSTHREDAIVVGSIVSVRFREEGHTNVATAIALQRLTVSR
jgi:Domain of unknown function (DUF5666)